MSSSKKPKLSASMANVSYTNAVYFPNERIYKGDTPGQLNYGCVNMVYYAYAAVAPDGSVFVSTVNGVGMMGEKNMNRTKLG